MERRKINKVVRVDLYGGLIGSSMTNPRKALEDVIQKHNAEGWHCHQVIPHETRNFLVSLLQGVLLVITLFLFTFSGAYLLIFEKDNTDNSHNVSGRDGITGDFVYTADNGKITITRYEGGKGGVVIPERIDNLPVVSIGASAFAYNNLTSVVIPASILNIGESAFAGNRLKSVSISNDTSMGEGAFDPEVEITRR